jgi:hypothetical protein
VNGALALLGGSRSPDATAALGTLASLRLDKPQEGWRLSADEASQARILPLFGAEETTLLWGGGCGLFAQGGKPARGPTKATSIMRTAGCRAPTSTDCRPRWRRPPARAWRPAPGLFFVGGDDGSHYGKPPADHPGQSRDILFIDLGDARTQGRRPMADAAGDGAAAAPRP